MPSGGNGYRATQNSEPETEKEHNEMSISSEDCPDPEKEEEGCGGEGNMIQDANSLFNSLTVCEWGRWIKID